MPARFGANCGPPAVCWIAILGGEADLADCVRLAELHSPRSMVSNEGASRGSPPSCPTGSRSTWWAAVIAARPCRSINVYLTDVEPKLVTEESLRSGCPFPARPGNGSLCGSASGGLHRAAGRVMLRNAGIRVSGMPASGIECREPGVCLIAEFDDGRATEYHGRCRPLPTIADGPAFPGREGRIQRDLPITVTGAP